MLESFTYDDKLSALREELIRNHFLAGSKEQCMLPLGSQKLSELTFKALSQIYNSYIDEQRSLQ